MIAIVDYDMGNLKSVQKAFEAVPWQDVAKGKAKLDSPAMLDFKAQALAYIDKMAQVESGASARQASIAQWKSIIESPSVWSNNDMRAIVHGLKAAVDAADQANEARSKGLMDIGANPNVVTKGNKRYEKRADGWHEVGGG